MKLSNQTRAEIIAHNRYALKLAMRLDVQKPGERQPPRNLCQQFVATEQRIADVATRRFKRAARRGRCVYLLTVCRKEWSCSAGSLSPALVKQVREWMSRRARRLAAFGQQRMLGFVDIAWNDRSGVGEPSHWAVHAHVIIRLKVPARYDAELMIKEAFACPGDPVFVRKTVDVPRLATEDDVQRASDYCAKAMQLDLSRGRWSYVNKKGRRNTNKVSLPRAREMEVAKLLNEIGPQKLWVLSGLRRRGDKVDLHQTSLRKSTQLRHLRNNQAVARAKGLKVNR